VGSKTLLQQNSSVLNYGCWLLQAFLYNGHKMVVGLLGGCKYSSALVSAAR